MPRLGTRWLLRSLAVYLTGATAMGLALWLVAGTWAERQARQQLAGLLAAALEGALDPPDVDRLSALLTAALSGQVGRLSVLDATGRVLADTQESPERIENQLARPELAAARRTGRGLTRQRVPWAAGRVLTLATRIGDAEHPRGYVRLSRPLPPTAAPGQWFWMAWGALTMVGLLVAGRRASRTATWLEQLDEALRGAARGETAAGRLVVDDRELMLVSETFQRAAQAQAQRLADLREQGERLATVLGGMIEGVIAVDGRQHILFANQAARALLELHTTDGAGRPLWEVVRNRAVQQAAETAVRSQQPCTLEFEVAGKARRVLSLYATRLPGDPPRGAVLVLHDVTELRRLENLRQEFVANVSHELKTPLTAIKAYAETLRSGAIHDPQHNLAFLQRIEEQAERLHELILDLLSLARIEAGQEHFEIEPLDVERCVGRILSLHRAAAEARHLVLEAEPPPAPLEVLADEEGLREILDNLVNNALKYTPEGGRVTLGWTLEASGVRLAVSDTGIGIATQELSRIFERFYRVDKARSRELGGTGLGLSIVKHLAQAFGGRVSVSSQVGRGSTFSVWLPGGPAGGAPALASPAAEPPAG